MTAIKSKNGISLSGELVFSNASNTLSQGNKIIQEYIAEQQAENTDGSSLVVNCTEISRVDSAGIALLLEWQRQCKNVNKKCSLEGLPNQAQSLIEAYRLQSLLSE